MMSDRERESIMKNIRQEVKLNKIALLHFIILAAIAWNFMGCGSGKKHYAIERVTEIPDYQHAAQKSDEASKKNLPEMTADEFEMLGDSLLGRKTLHLAYLQYERSLKLNPDNLRV